MVRASITLVETSSQGHIALVFDANFHITDSTGKIVASTSDDVDASVAKIGGANKDRIITVAFSQDGSLFATCNNEKTVTIYNTADWTAVRSLIIAKRATAITFDPSGAYLLIADKFGEVHRTPTALSADEAASKPELLLGHVSIVCDVKMSYGSPSYVLTCDRDEKLRVSKYPNAYNIQSFGLGHTEFVTTIATAQFAPNNAVTGSGDGTLRLWDISSGQLVQTVDLQELLEPYYTDGRVLMGVSNFEDRNAATQRYGVLRVRSIEGQRMFVAAVERFPVVVVLSFGEGPALANVRVVDVARPVADVAVLGDRIVAAYAPPSGETDSDDLAVVLEPTNGDLATDVTLSAALNALSTQQIETAAPAPSIYVWGNKMYMDPPKDDED
ncbi:hypothetical protein IWW43_005230 [Coemansia sp. RSA 1935]|nr:hypothetical protein J3F82_005145 [Coemansia sp. RSA 637]KAJ2195274.1 hypothetical protein IW144_003538 [Coemansia sp. RSA 522]KAJ2410396.1 hypothetical protein J3F80_000589 [Coemansia sp. RSA 2526]KAJ2528798.1 hypothetical protein IWW43_005230 [Coemansia sp. RSA 1935]KAJ2594244.1 hypothetical protein IWW49_000049 [Coemansia sp. RSA 1797]